MSHPEGHRERLRLRFSENPHSLSEVELLELLLTYAIPRRDLSELAYELLRHFGTLHGLLTTPASDLEHIPGLGGSTTLFIQVLQRLLIQSQSSQEGTSAMSNPQLNLFEEFPGGDESKGRKTIIRKAPRVKTMRVFANDEVATSLKFLPEIERFQSLEYYKQFLLDHLPYNSSETRLRRANAILERFFPDGLFPSPLTFFLGNHPSPQDLKSVIFYHILKAEPIAAKMADEFIWPALPLGRVEREDLRKFVLRYLPEAGESSQQNMLRGLLNTYHLLEAGSLQDTTLRFHLRRGTFPAFLYVLTSEFPEPGIYSFEALDHSPVHRWMLWDREWMRRQLYNLQDLSILDKVTQIDTVEQFTLLQNQADALRLFFENYHPAQALLRESDESPSIEPEES